MRSIVALALSCSLTYGAEKWIHATTPNFEIYTSQDERTAKETLLYFEQVREFFEKALGMKPSATVPVRIILFASEKQYAPYRFNEFATAYYAQAIDRDYIVMSARSAEASRVAVHEYIHLLCSHAGLRLPVWLNEGLAEVYSTLRPLGGKATVGTPIDGHLLQVRSNWIPLTRLMEVQHASPEYNKRAHAGTFYSESWALTHMLMLADEYRPKFNNFFRQVVEGGDSQAAMQKAFGSGTDKVESDLKKYVRADRFFAAVFPFKLEKASVVPTIEVVDAVAARAATTGVLIGFRQADAEKAIEELLVAHSGRPDVSELAAYAAWRAGDYAKASELFDKALSRPDVPAKLFLDAARLQLYRSAPDERGIAWTKKALELHPDWFEALIQLAEQYLAMRNYQASIAVVRRATTAELKHASRFYRVAAYAAAANGFLEEAETSTGFAKKYALDMRDREALERLQTYVTAVRQAKEKSHAPAAVSAQQLLQPLDTSEDDDREPARPILARRTPGQSAFEIIPKHEVLSVSGLLIKLECSGQLATVHIQSGDAVTVLAIRDPNNIAVKSGTGQAELSCGDMRREVTVGYLARADAQLGTLGDLATIEFKN